MPWYVYILERLDGKKSYAGKTNDPKRRLRQHNGEIAGGARYTRGQKWRMKYLIAGFPDNNTALRLECTLKKKYKCKERAAIMRSKNFVAASAAFFSEHGILRRRPADLRMRLALATMQKTRITKKAKKNTADLPLEILVHPDLDQLQ